MKVFEPNRIGLWIVFGHNIMGNDTFTGKFWTHGWLFV